MGGRIKLYTDEHVSRAVVRGLRQRGLDVLTAVDAGMVGASDLDHLRRAQEDGRVVFTQDDDFLRLAAQGARHVGIIYAPQHTRIGEIIHGLMLIYQVMGAEEMGDQVEYL